MKARTSDKNRSKSLLNASQAAALIGVSRTTFYRMRKSGGVPFVKQGSTVMYSKSALKRYFKL